MEQEEKSLKTTQSNDEASQGSKSVMVDAKISTDTAYAHFAEFAPLLSLENVHFPSHWQPEAIMFAGAFATGVQFYDTKYDEYFEFTTRAHRKRLKTFRINFSLKEKFRASSPLIDLIRHSSFYLAFFFFLGSFFFFAAELLNYLDTSHYLVLILQTIKGAFFLLGAIAGFIEVIDPPTLVQLEKEFLSGVKYYRKLHLPLKAKAEHIMKNTRSFANFSLHQLAFWSSSYLLSAVCLLTTVDIANFVIYRKDLSNDLSLKFNLEVVFFVGSILLLIANFIKFIEISHFMKKPLQYKSFGYWAVVSFLILSVGILIGASNVLFSFTSNKVQEGCFIASAVFTTIGSSLLYLELKFT
eukprot:NODE_67_length_23829_cov_0.557059.p8 type:complete len:355 gc:universal NODE_67_length_23829_cov_0.557059:10014-11078(+)